MFKSRLSLLVAKKVDVYSITMCVYLLKELCMYKYAIINSMILMVHTDDINEEKKFIPYYNVSEFIPYRLPNIFMSVLL